MASIPAKDNADSLPSADMQAKPTATSDDQEPVGDERALLDSIKDDSSQEDEGTQADVLTCAAKAAAADFQMHST